MIRKADVVLFQDCWMATLETAFELQDLARYVVGSQSLVPIGYTYTGGVMSAPTGPVWPYSAMIGRLLAQPTDFIDALNQDLKVFYADSAARAPFPAAFVSVLDLGVADEIAVNVKPRMFALVSALSMINSAPSAKSLRKILFIGGSAYGPLPLVGDLEYGDWALRDVVKLCEYLKVTANHPPGLGAASLAVAAAAVGVLNAVKGTGPGSYSLVKDTFCKPPGANPFTGISILWMPDVRGAIPASDGYLGKQVDHTFYTGLKLVKQTKSGTDSWADFAFEQLT